MSQVIVHLLALVRLTLSDAQSGARAVLGGALPVQALWTLFFLVVVLSGLLSQITLMIIPMPEEADMALPGGGLFIGAAVGVGIILMAVCVCGIGRAFGGTGSMNESVLLMVWLQFVMVALQIVQTLFALVSPTSAALVGWIGVALMMWLMTNFIAVLHGFKSLGQVFVMIIASMIGIAFGASLLIGLATLFLSNGA